MTAPQHPIPIGGFPAAAVIIGASTGGPPVVEQILRKLPRDFPAPVAICQHMSPGFVGQWADRLGPLCWLHVKEAEHGEPFACGTVYIAPEGRHLRFWCDTKGPRIRLEADSSGSAHVPCIDIAFSSAAETFGGRALGVLLTGLGRDGALGMQALRRVGAYTIAEDPSEAAAPSMPAAAIELGAALEVVPAAALPHVLPLRANGDYSG